MRVECNRRKKMIREITRSVDVRRANEGKPGRFIDIPRRTEQGATLSIGHSREMREREREREMQLPRGWIKFK